SAELAQREEAGVARPELDDHEVEVAQDRAEVDVEAADRDAGRSELKDLDVLQVLLVEVDDLPGEPLVGRDEADQRFALVLVEGDLVVLTLLFDLLRRGGRGQREEQGKGERGPDQELPSSGMHPSPPSESG